MEKWKSKFPDVSFEGKVVVLIGEAWGERCEAHLIDVSANLNDPAVVASDYKRLEDVDWDKVEYCFDAIPVGEYGIDFYT